MALYCESQARVPYSASAFAELKDRNPDDAHVFALAPVLSPEKIESRGKLKDSEKFQKFRERFKFSRENSKLRAKIQIFSGTFPVSPEIRNFSRKIKFPAEVFKSPLKIRIVSRKTETSAED